MLFTTLPDGGSNFLQFHWFKTGIFRVRMHDFSILHFYSSEQFPLHQCLSQYSETGYLKLAVVNFWASKFKWGSQYTHISTINMYKFIKIRHDIIKQCHGKLGIIRR